MIFQPPNVSEEPIIELSRWSIRSAVGENGEKSSHFIGTADGYGRVSSAIVEWKSSTEALTSSGRVYKLVGMEGHSMDAEYVWSKWLKFNQLTEENL